MRVTRVVNSQARKRQKIVERLAEEGAQRVAQRVAQENERVEEQDRREAETREREQSVNILVVPATKRDLILPDAVTATTLKAGH